jgi:hypothetical protein
MKGLSTKVVHLLPISITLLLGIAAYGDPRRTEKRDEATHVFTGKVKTLNAQNGEGVVFYNVAVVLDGVEKGEGVQPGDTVLVNCYVSFSSPGRQKEKGRDKILKIGPPLGSYSGVPKEKERIKVYARKVNEEYDGIYPDWYDAMEPK